MIASVAGTLARLEVSEFWSGPVLRLLLALANRALLVRSHARTTVAQITRPPRFLARAIRGGRALLGGRVNMGFCPVCESRTLFVEAGPWLRDQYFCVRCHSIPRYRALTIVLNETFPSWRSLTIHEGSPSGPASAKFKRECRGYSASHYLLPQVPRGARAGDATCQDLESMTLLDESIDVLITQDVFEHVLRPELAIKEIARVLRPGGAHIFTVPVYRGRSTLVRAVPSDTGVRHLEPPEYHGNPVDPAGSLVVREWGDDIVDFITANCGLTTQAYPFHDRARGLDGEFLEVFVTRK